MLKIFQTENIKLQEYELILRILLQYNSTLFKNLDILHRIKLHSINLDEIEKTHLSFNDIFQLMLRIRGEEGSSNCRFSIENEADINKNTRTIKVKYSAINKKVYNFSNDDTFKENKYYTSDDKDKTVPQQEIVCGPYNQIFNKSQTNEDIANSEYIKSYIKDIQSGKIVCFFAYAPSGAGKTYTLLGDSKSNTPGISIYMCNQMMNYSNKLEIDMFEIGVFSEGDSKLNNFNKQTFTKHDIKKDETYVWMTNNNKKTLTDFLIEKTKERKTFATPNNKESSRTHLCIIFNFEGKIFVIFDFAGVEGRFDCKQLLGKFAEDYAVKLKTKDFDDRIKNTLNITNTEKNFILSFLKNDDGTLTTDEINFIDSNIIGNGKNLNFFNTNGFSFSSDELKKYQKYKSHFDDIIDKGTLGKIIKNNDSDIIYGIKSKMIKKNEIIFKNAGKPLEVYLQDLVRIRTVYNDNIENEHNKKLNKENYNKKLIKICEDRNKEGVEIVRNLSLIRNFTSYFINLVYKKSDEIYFEPFYKDCCFFQCNPLFKECFKTNTENDVIMEENKIIEMFCNKILSLDNKTKKNDIDIFKNMKICYVGILNVSKKYNDPEVYPNISYSQLQILFERMKNRNFFRTDDKFDNELFKVLNKIRINFGLELHYPEYIDNSEELKELKELKDQNLSLIYLEENIPIKTLNEQIITRVDNLSKQILDISKIEDKNAFTKKLLYELYEYNSITPIGTLLYLNSIIQMNSPESMIACNLKDQEFFEKMSVEIYNDFLSLINNGFKKIKGEIEKKDDINKSSDVVKPEGDVEPEGVVEKQKSKKDVTNSRSKITGSSSTNQGKNVVKNLNIKSNTRNR